MIRPTVPCELCGTQTPMLGTKRCDRCWEIEHRIEQDPEIARKVLERIDGPRWKCKDGRLLTPSDMETDHIKNCVTMLRRAGYVSMEEHGELPTPPTGFDPESAASYYADQEWDRMVDEYLSAKVTRWLDLFESELKRRKESSPPTRSM